MPQAPRHPLLAVCLDWGGTLMDETCGPPDVPMALWPQVRVLAGAAEALARLHGRVPLAIATNANVSRRDMIERALARAGLARYFDGGAIFFAADLGCRKDEPAFWQAVQRGLGVPLAQVAMVVDSLVQDVLAPRRWGVQAVWLRPAVGRIRADPPDDSDHAGGLDGGQVGGGADPLPPEAAGVQTVSDLRAFADWVLAAVEPAG